jgi:hypothetical protein
MLCLRNGLIAMIRRAYIQNENMLQQVFRECLSRPPSRETIVGRGYFGDMVYSLFSKHKYKTSKNI